MTAVTSAVARSMGRALMLLLLAACGPSPRPAARVLRVALPSDVQTVDPHVSNTSGSYTVLGNVYEALVVTDPGLRRRPGLALRWHNPDPLTWDFELDPRARFHVGKAVDPADVVFSLNRALSQPDLGARYYLGDVSRAEISGPMSVRVRLKRRSPVLLHKLGHVFIVPAGSSRSSLERAPRGTGAYRIESWTPGLGLDLAAASDGRRSPAPIERVRLRLNVAAGEAARQLKAGETDMALLGLTRGAEVLPAAEFAEHRRVSLQVKYLACVLGRSGTPQVAGRNPFRDRRVRQAIHLGIDRGALVAGLPTDAVAANQLVPRHVFGFDANLPEQGPEPDRARALLKEAGFDGGFAVTLHTREILSEAAQLLAPQLRRLGIEVRLQIQPDPEYFAALERDASLWLDRWSCTTGDSGEMFENAFHTPDSARGLGEFNESSFRDDALDAAIEEALLVEDLPRRRVALAGLMQRVMHELVWVPLYTDGELWAVRRSFAWKPRSDYWLQLAEVAPGDALR